jgi:hypothetical protein
MFENVYNFKQLNPRLRDLYTSEDDWDKELAYLKFFNEKNNEIPMSKRPKNVPESLEYQSASSYDIPEDEDEDEFNDEVDLAKFRPTQLNFN